MSRQLKHNLLVSNQALKDEELKIKVITILDWSILILGQPRYIGKNFLCSWEVAGALIEKCEAIAVDWTELEPDHWRNMNHTANTPRAIIERCVELINE